MHFKKIFSKKLSALKFVFYEKTHNPLESVFPHDNHPLYSVCRKYKQCGESPTGGFYDNFGGDTFTDDAPHDSLMRSVFFRMEQPYGRFYAAMALRAVYT